MHNEIEILIEERNHIIEKISTIMNKLKEWFIDKINNLKELFRNIKDVIVSSIRGTDQNGTISKDIQSNGETIVKKGTPVKVVTKDIKSGVSKLQITTNVVINDCKDGIESVSNGNKDKAIKIKNKVVDKIKNITLIITPLMAGALALTLYKKNKNDRNEFDTKVNRMKSEIVSDVKDKIRKEMEDDKQSEIEAERYANMVNDVVEFVPDEVKGKTNVTGIKKTMKLTYNLLDKLNKKGMF